MTQIEEHYNKVYRYCYFRVRSAALAEDITQETFTRFFASHNYINRGKPLAYLYTVAKNLCADSFRRPAESPIEEASSVSFIAPFSTAETSYALKQAMDTLLTTDEREVLLLRYANDLSMAEISQVTGASRFAARRLINAALKKLRQVIKKEDFRE